MGTALRLADESAQAPLGGVAAPPPTLAGPGVTAIWSWWTVVLVVNDPRWACMRRVSASDVIGSPVETGTD